jgi:uracil-DNA glycosylase
MTQQIHQFCPGYVTPPFTTLVAEPPGEEIYPAKDFRVEWGPIFHRGRLDGTAKVLVIGQDPATHESITRRILVGEAGQRVQGLLAKIGITTSYIMINTFVYSVYGQGGGNRHAKDAAIAEYRHRWLDALLVPATPGAVPAGGPITAVITLGSLADRGYTAWAKTRPDIAAALHHAAVKHPTYPDSASAAGQITLAAATTKLLADWNRHLPALRRNVVPDEPSAANPPIPYGKSWQDGDLAPIPELDLPAGSPAWWRSMRGWAARTGRNAQLKRATITVTIPAEDRTWPVV